MKQRMICKGLAVAVILLFIGLGVQPVIGQPNVKNQLSSLNEEIENIIINQNPDFSGSLKRKVYLGCQVEVNPDGFPGIVLLFPSILRTMFHSDELLFIIMNSGIILPGVGGPLYLENDIYKEFLFVNIIGFTGYFKVISVFPKIPPKFYLNGTALYVVIYYK
jgi:hypothetical protein